MSDEAQRPGRLSVVGTPIGNLDDITLRALATLRGADLILAEDTRHSRKLLHHHGIAAKLRALHAHSSDAVVERCLEDLAAGLQLALISDAGTPLISDPGARLVREATARGITVETIPGPSAVIAALSVCGVPFDAFRFAGFAPRTGGRREAWLDAIAEHRDASVFFESPARLADTLRELAERLSQERPVAVCRELTKLHEQVVRGNAATLAQAFAGGARGEITVVVGAGDPSASRTRAPDEPLEARIDALLAAGSTPRDAARSLARELGLSRREVYARVQALAGKKQE